VTYRDGARVNDGNGSTDLLTLLGRVALLCDIAEAAQELLDVTDGHWTRGLDATDERNVYWTRNKLRLLLKRWEAVK
jgi:hypothetical protein